MGAPDRGLAGSSVGNQICGKVGDDATHGNDWDSTKVKVHAVQ